MHRLRWNSDIRLKELSDLLDTIDDRALLEASIDLYNIPDYEINSHYITDFRRLRDTKRAKRWSGFRNDVSILKIWDKLFWKSIFDLRITTPVDDKIAKLLAKSLEVNKIEGNF